ncbi:MAG TPA: hypothetical protein VLI72_04650 [Methylibium sp.]|nr:hypothetical protein [Methylibium sp.]
MSTTASRNQDPGTPTYAVDAEPDQTLRPEPAVDPARLARLFRHTVRVGGVNPLLHLTPRVRKERAP